MKAYKGIGQKPVTYKEIQRKVLCMYKSGMIQNESTKKRKNEDRNGKVEKVLGPPCKKNVVDAHKERKKGIRGESTNENAHPNIKQLTAEEIIHQQNEARVNIQKICESQTAHRGPENQETLFLDKEVCLVEMEHNDGENDSNSFWF